jgi:glycosyltransferase involved in cell wall biosynthesis
MSVSGKVALVIDALPAMGGAERVLMDAMQLFPDAPVYTLHYNRRAFIDRPIASRKVISSFIDRLPQARVNYRRYLPLMPLAVRLFDLGAYDLILSFSYAVAHGVRTRRGQQHLSYTFTPMRYAWRKIGVNGKEEPASLLSRWFFEPFRMWDRSAIRGVDRLATVSEWIADLVGCTYQRQAQVIYPPVDVERFSPNREHSDYFITISRLVPHKRLDLIIQAFNSLKLPLLVIGEGPERAHLEQMAGPNIHFLGYLSDQAVAEVLACGRAFISAGEEDFGLATVEAQAAGIPVIAYRKGGALETVIEGETGVFFDDPSPRALAKAVEYLRSTQQQFNPTHIAASVQRFNKQRFLREFSEFTQL